MAVKCPACQFVNTSDSKFCKECGTKFGVPDQISLTKTIETGAGEFGRGATFAGRYEIIEELGTGGMGRVFRVYDTKIKEEVALKLLKPEIASERRTIERFSNEIKYARKIVHKNVCRMFDMGEDRGTHFITMEYVAGEDLKSFLRRAAPLNTGRAVSLGREIAEGLAEAHKTGLVHRDLKPGNIMIDKEGHARIMDFGIAKSLSGKAVTGEGAMIGTPEYMSPEQVEGKEADRRADIYALGIILFEMVTGRTPFEGNTPLAIAVKHKSEPPPAPRAVNPQVPPDLDKLILRCLEKDKGRRYQTAEELATDLTAIEDALPTTDRTAAKRTSTKRKPTLSTKIMVDITPRKVIIAIATVLVIAVSGYLLWRYVIHPPTPPTESGIPTIAVLDFENLSGDESQAFWRKGLPLMLTTGLYQSRLINVLPDETVYELLKKFDLTEVKRFTSKDIDRIAREGRIDYVVTGAYINAGGKIIITSTLHDMRIGQAMKRASIECQDAKEIPSKINDLTLQIKRDLNFQSEQLAADAENYMKVEDATTDSPEALQRYIEGRQFAMRGDWRKSIECMEKAVATDPEFAMAYRSMAASYGNMGYLNEEQQYGNKALQLSKRVSLRERLMIEGNFADTNRTAVEKFRKIVEIYPFDRIANHLLGFFYNAMGEYEKAVASYEVNVRTGNPSPLNVSNLASAYMNIEKFEEAERLCEKFRDLLSQSKFRFKLAEVYLIEGKYEQGILEAEKIERSLSVPRDHLLMGDLYLLKGDFPDAEKEYEKLLDSEEAAERFLGYYNLFLLYRTQGRFLKAQDEIDRAIELGKQQQQLSWSIPASFLSIDGKLSRQDVSGAMAEWNKYSPEYSKSEDLNANLAFRKAQISAMMKNFPEALDAADIVKRWCEGLYERQGFVNLIRFFDFLRGLIALNEGHYSEAVLQLEKAVSLLSGPAWRQSEANSMPLYDACFIEALSQAYEKAGDLDKARQAYERITRLSMGRQSWGDTYARAYYNLGRICEKQHDTHNARLNYGRFLGFWENADPGIREVEDAKKRLAGL